VRIEAELERKPVDGAARKEPVERRLRCEGTPDERDVLPRLRRRHERFGAPRRAQQCGVDARRRGEARARHAPDESQLMPRSPRAPKQRRRPHCRPLRGQPPLHDCVEPGQRDFRIAEKPPEDRCACRERQVGDDGERLARQWQRRCVSRDDLDPRLACEARLQLAEGGRVELDGSHPSPRVQERACEQAAAGPEVEHERIGRDA